MEHLGAQGVGKSFFVYKYKEIDFTLPRIEKKVGAGHRGFDVTLAKEEKEASKRRDFTVNALMYDIENEEILDFWQGLDDLKNRVLRVVDKDSFTEDSLRVLRAMQFAARLGFKVEEESCRLCQCINLNDLPKERIFKEFEKMFHAKYLDHGLYYLFALGVAKQLWGEVLSRENFIRLGRLLQKSQKYFIKKLRPYYFLFICRFYFKTDMNEILERIGAPNSYYKKVANVALPVEVTSAFIAYQSFNEPIVEYVGNWHPEVIRMAKSLNVWNRVFDRGVTPAQLMDEGFSGKALGEELERRTAQVIKDLKEK
jgi:tRNA nucleotidyltransferase (CCA-adding enzyme)